MNRWIRVVAAVAVVAFVAFAVVQSRDITGVVEDVAGTSTPLVLSIIAAAAFLETAVPVLSAFMPGEFTVVLAGSLAATGVLDPATVLLVVWPCSFVGDLTSFAIGRRYGRPLLRRSSGRLKLSNQQLDSADAAIERFGTPSILVGRFLPVARALVPFTAGAGPMKARSFVAVDLAATGAFSVAFVGAGYYGTDLYRSAPWALLAVAGTVVAAVVIRRRIRAKNEPTSHGSDTQRRSWSLDICRRRARAVGAGRSVPISVVRMVGVPERRSSPTTTVGAQDWPSHE